MDEEEAEAALSRLDVNGVGRRTKGGGDEVVDENEEAVGGSMESANEPDDEADEAADSIAETGGESASTLQAANTTIPVTSRGSRRWREWAIER